MAVIVEEIRYNKIDNWWGINKRPIHLWLSGIEPSTIHCTIDEEGSALGPAEIEYLPLPTNWLAV